MIKCASIFSQLLSLFPRGEFYHLVSQHNAEKWSKGFTCWSQFVAMLFCQLAQAKSLREICGGLKCCIGKLIHLGVAKAPNKSTLSYANEHRPWELYRDLFYKLLGRCRSVAPKKKFRFRNRLLSLDATVIDLCLELFPWSKLWRTKGAVKLHMLLDHDGYLPVYALITEGNVHEVKIAQTLELPQESIVAFDKGYTDYALFGRLTDKKVWFVTRMRKNAQFKVISRNLPPKYRNILADEQIMFTGKKAIEDCPHLLRRVVVWDKENERELVLLTNHFKFGASTISAIYKDRWSIEIFFKQLKQNLKIKTFVGTSKNALKIQIWTALIAILLIKFLKFRSRLGWSLSNLVALLRWNLFTYRDLWEWIDRPFETLPYSPPPEQMTLPDDSFGQHQHNKGNLVLKLAKSV